MKEVFLGKSVERGNAAVTAGDEHPKLRPKMDVRETSLSEGRGRVAAAGSRVSRRTKPDSRFVRRGSALLLVVTLLGILFVTGVAFMATMNFETENVKLSQQAGRHRAGVRAAAQMTNTLGTKTLITTPGVTSGAGLVSSPETMAAWRAYGPALAEWVRNGSRHPSPDPPNFVGSTLAFAEMPAVHGMFSPIEPYVYVDDDPTTSDPLIWPWFTDLERMHNPKDPPDEWSFENERFINTKSRAYGLLQAKRGSAPSPKVADADGDGIVDSIMVSLDRLGIPRSQIGEIARAVNVPSGPQDSAYLAARIVPHGGMVNLNDAHPRLIENIMDIYGLWYPRKASERPQRYAPEIEEAPLRRRGFLPPKLLSPTLLQGNALDMSDPDHPGRGHFAKYLFPENTDISRYRYWPFDLHEDDDIQTWASRMNPNSMGTAYDRRHLVTTTSHDDLLARPTEVRLLDSATGLFLSHDAVSLMIKASQVGSESCASAANLPTFEYPNYPHTLENGPRGRTWCDCVESKPLGSCRFDARKGRLRLSLPWLDQAFADGDIDVEQRSRLIQDVFMLLLLNARGTEWDSEEEYNTHLPSPYRDPSRAEYGEWKYSPEALSRLEFTAASLTANLLDFADRDDVPSLVPVRSMNFADSRLVGRQVLDSNNKPVFAYGLERQPFVTEVASRVRDDLKPDGVSDAESWYAVEVFNPYDVALPTPTQSSYGVAFFLRIGDSGVSIPLDNIPPQSFLVVTDASITEADADEFLEFHPAASTQTGASLSFREGETIYLLMRVDYKPPSGNGTVEIVVDQFELPQGTGVGYLTRDEDSLAKTRQRKTNNAPDMQRWATTRPWFAPIPQTVEKLIESGVDVLGGENTAFDLTLRPVQLYFGNNGAPPPGIAGGTPNTGTLSQAFPTTGSLLLLMRHANRAISDPADQKAFTTQLVQEAQQIDNGRMPVFDTMMPPRHHIDPARNPFDPLRPQPRGQPGDVSQLPWGQLVFDYFTALPLSNPGPWENPTGLDDVEFEEMQQAAQPRVDREGLRVHGRVDLNAAPWKAVEGLPLIPMAEIPAGASMGNPPLLRAAIRKGVGLVKDTAADPLNPTPNERVVEDNIAETIGDELAKAIVAYRELRVLGDAGETGNYGFDAAGGFGRGWVMEDRATVSPIERNPTMRRGTGFVSVGELANVRHPNAAAEAGGFSLYRTDGGVVGNRTGQEDYLSAVAFLVALGDWVGLRSHVYTIYGSLWGEQAVNVSVEELENRALRFQETVDRLDTFLGAPSPSRITRQTVARYKDIHGD